MINLYANWQRNLYKQIYRNFFPKNMHHNKNFWPFYRVIRDENNYIKSIYFKGEKLPIVNQWHPKKKNIMLVATGPSVKKLDKKLFSHQDFDYIGVNGAIALGYCKFEYYCIFDPGFIKNRADLVMQILLEVNYLFVSAECLNLILTNFKLTDIRCKLTLLERVNLHNQVEFFMSEKKELTDEFSNHAYIENGLGFSKNINRFVFDYHTIAYVALQVSSYLRYEKVYMVGVDFTDLGKPRFYENLNNKQCTALHNFIDCIEQAFHLASCYFNDNQIKVVNLSAESIIECFEKKIIKND